jgi:hypothetical protein
VPVFAPRLALALARRLPPVPLAEPWALFIKAACIVSGGAYLAGLTPRSIDVLLPAWLVAVWNAELVLGGLLGVAGLFRRWWRVEYAGLVCLGAAAVRAGDEAAAARAAVAALQVDLTDEQLERLADKVTARLGRLAGSIELFPAQGPNT